MTPTALLTHLQQLLTAGLPLAFGLLALRVWRRAPQPRTDRATLAWGVTAAYFVICHGYATGHATIAAAADLGAGRDSALFHWVGSWAVAANLARGALASAFALVLLAVLVLHRRRQYRTARAAPALFTVFAAGGTAVALQFPLHTSFDLGTGLAVLSMLTAIALMGALLAAVLNDGMDQLLWGALALYTLKETVSVSLFAILAWWSTAPDMQAWHIFHWGSAVLGAGMVGIAVRRLRLAGEGRRVPALFERVYTLRRSPAS